MKKFLSLLLIFSIFNFFCSPVMSADRVIKKPRVNVFNRAIKNGDIERVKAYINAGFDPNETYWGTSVISTAIDENQNEMLDFLLDNGAVVNPPKSQVSPLLASITYNNVYAAQKLIDKGADVNKTFMGIRECDIGLRAAIKNYNNELLDLFLSHGANPNASYSPSMLLFAVSKNNAYAAQRLIQNGADINQIYLGYPVQSYGMEKAISKHNNDLLDAFLNNNADPNAKFSVPLLYDAVNKNNLYAVEKLIQKGADQDQTFMNITAEQLAFKKGYKDINTIFSMYDKNRSKITQNSTNIDDAIKLLQNTILGSIFYDYIKGKNLTQKEIIVQYKNLESIDKKYKNLLAVSWKVKDQLYIYINPSLKQSSPEAIATLIASVSIHQDERDSINEEIYSAMLQAALWTGFTQTNPNLRLEQSNLVNTLNYYADYWKNNNYDINTFKPLIKGNDLYKSLRQTSPGFSNEDIGLLKDESIIKKTTDNVSSYCKAHDVSTKLKTSCEVIALLGLVALGVAAVYQASQSMYTPLYTPVYTPAPSVGPAVVPNYKYTYNGKTNSINTTLKSITIRNFY